MEIKTKSQWYKFQKDNKIALNGAEIYKPSEVLALKKKPVGKWMIRNLKFPMVSYPDIDFDIIDDRTWKEINYLHFDDDLICFSPIVPEENCIIRGSTDGTFIDGNQTKGVTHRQVKNWHQYSPNRIRFIMCEHWDTILDWIDMFPNHIIEFSLFDQPVGVSKSRLIIWEIRKY